MNQALNLTVMMYHYVRDPGDAAEAGSGISGMSTKTFEAQLDILSRQYTMVSWSEVCAALEDRKSLPHSACLLTFDDGVCDHYLNAFRILRDRNLSGLFFVLARNQNDGLVLGHKLHFLLAKMGLNELRSAIWEKLDGAQRERYLVAEQRYQVQYSGNTLNERINLLKAVLQRDLSIEANPLLSTLFDAHVGDEHAIAREYYLNADQIREMSADGMHFGGHSRTHPWFDWIIVEQRNQEILASADHLRAIESGLRAFAFPYGGISDDAPELLEKHGFAAAFTTKPQTVHTNPYFIGRLDGEDITQEGSSYA